MFLNDWTVGVHSFNVDSLGANLSTGEGEWHSDIRHGANGRVEVTMLTSTQITGTFSFVAEPCDQALGQAQVTNGHFSVPIITYPSPPAGTLTATVNGMVHTSGFTQAVRDSVGRICIIGEERLTDPSAASLTFFLDSEDWSVGEHSFSSGLASGAVNRFPGDVCAMQDFWRSGQVGSIVVETSTNTRLTGTFSFEASSVDSSGTIPAVLTVTNGVFDVGIVDELPNPFGMSLQFRVR